MISILIGIQAVCLGVSTTYLALQLKSNKKPNLKLVSKNQKGFKHYKTGGL